MMKRVLALAAAAVAALCCFGCTSSSGAHYEFGNGSVTAKGNTLTVALEGNITTGFQWTATLDGTALAPKEDAYKADKSNQPAAAGGGGVHTFVYEAAGTGSATITFQYARPWEDEPPFRTAVVKVTVKNGAITDTATFFNGAHVGESHGK